MPFHYKLINAPLQAMHQRSLEKCSLHNLLAQVFALVSPFSNPSRAGINKSAHGSAIRPSRKFRANANVSMQLERRRVHLSRLAKRRRIA